MALRLSKTLRIGWKQVPKRAESDRTFKNRGCTSDQELVVIGGVGSELPKKEISR